MSTKKNVKKVYKFLNDLLNKGLFILVINNYMHLVLTEFLGLRGIEFIKLNLHRYVLLMVISFFIAYLLVIKKIVEFS